MDFAVLKNRRLKIKQNKKIDKYLETKQKDRQILRTIQRHLKDMAQSNTNCNWCIENLEKGVEEVEISDRMEIIQTTSFLGSVAMLRYEEACTKRLPANTGVKIMACSVEIM